MREVVIPTRVIRPTTISISIAIVSPRAVLSVGTLTVSFVVIRVIIAEISTAYAVAVVARASAVASIVVGGIFAIPLAIPVFVGPVDPPIAGQRPLSATMVMVLVVARVVDRVVSMPSGSMATTPLLALSGGAPRWVFATRGSQQKRLKHSERAVGAFLA